MAKSRSRSIRPVHVASCVSGRCRRGVTPSQQTVRAIITHDVVNHIFNALRPCVTHLYNVRFSPAFSIGFGFNLARPHHTAASRPSGPLFPLSATNGVFPLPLPSSRFAVYPYPILEFENKALSGVLVLSHPAIVLWRLVLKIDRESPL